MTTNTVGIDDTNMLTFGEESEYDFRAQPKGLPEADIITILAAPAEGRSCSYCGLSESDGDFRFYAQAAGGTLCQYCLVDPALGACGHSRFCDCQAGICN